MHANTCKGCFFCRFSVLIWKVSIYLMFYLCHTIICLPGAETFVFLDKTGNTELRIPHFFIFFYFSVPRAEDDCVGKVTDMKHFYLFFNCLTAQKPCLYIGVTAISRAGVVCCDVFTLIYRERAQREEGNRMVWVACQETEGSSPRQSPTLPSHPPPPTTGDAPQHCRGGQCWRDAKLCTFISLQISPTSSRHSLGHEWKCSLLDT